MIDSVSGDRYIQSLMLARYGKYSNNDCRHDKKPCKIKGRDLAHLFLQQRCCLYMSRIVRKLDFCLCENKGVDQLRSNCEADQRLCFSYTDSTISLLLKSQISSYIARAKLLINCMVTAIHQYIKQGFP